MAQIIPRGPNKWLVRVFVGRTNEGKTKYHNKVVHGRKKDARKYALATETKRDLGLLDDLKANELTFDTFLDEWLSEFKKDTVTERTFIGYQYILNRYVRPDLGKIKLSDLTTRRIQGLYTDLIRTGYSPRTIAFAHTLIRDALNHAVIDNLLSSILPFHDAPLTDYCQNSLIHNRNHGYRRASVLPPEVAQIAQSRF